MRKQKYILIDRTNPYRLGRPKCQILELKRATKKNNATIKISVPDELIEKIMADEIALNNCVIGDLNITSLALKWDELII